MCAIAGIFHYRDQHHPVDRELLVRMTRVLAHRGPDGEGFHLDGPVGLGHRRLAIVDLTPTGAQPMATADGRFWITYNGEFYDHASFREGLADKCFRGSSDTETMLHLLADRGPEALAETAAIFGLALWDARERRLVLARDPLGVKQVYYHDDGRRILFASEVKALLQAADVPREIDIEGLNQYLHFHTALFDRTFFKGIRQLTPGEYLEVSSAGLRCRSYWSITDFSHREAPHEAQVAALREQLDRVVADQLMSDVPVGAFFSGGIDSSAVASFAKRSGRPPRCFGVHFEGQGVVDERPYQEAAAQAIGVELDLLTLDGSTFADDLPRLIRSQDEPVIGPAMFPMDAVSRLASSQVKVCLGGQAADEIFGGYARYALVRPTQVLRSWLAGRRSVVQASDTSGPRTVSGNLVHQLARLENVRRLARGVHYVADWRTRYFEHFARVPEAAWCEVLEPEVVSRASARCLFADVLERSPAVDPIDKVMHWDLQTYLPGLFHQDDRMSMAHSLESRVPLADPRLVRFAFRTPPELKLRGGATKWILRQAVSDVLPAAVLSREKVGFPTPLDSWLERHRDFVRDTLLSSHARGRGLWRAAGVEAMLDRPAADVLWKTLCIETWARELLDPPGVREIRVPEVHVEGAEPMTPSTTERLRHTAQEVR